MDPYCFLRARCAGPLLAAATSLAFVAFASLPLHAWTSSKVQVDSAGHLSYPADSQGNRIPDFSHAGYEGGGVPLPDIPVVKTISPVSGDNTAAIQAAIDAVGALPMQANGYRGALLLSAGLYGVNGTLHLNKSGVVLAGMGNGSDPASNTVLRRTGTSTAEVIIAGGGSSDSFGTAVANSTSAITDAFVTVGSTQFNVDNPSLYHVGDSIVIHHPSTQAWINAVDTSKVWTAGQVDIRYPRIVTAIAGNTLTIDAPIFNTLNKSLAQSTVYKYDRSAYVTHVGIEDIFVDIVTAGATSEDHCNDVITFVQAENCWVRDTTDQHFVHAGFMFGGDAIHCTAERCQALSPNSVITGGRRYNFTTYHAQLCLFQDCYGSEGRHTFVANGTSTDGGNVVLNGTIDHPHAASEGHRLWSTGFLFDHIKTVNYVSADAPDVLGFYNRGTFGSGHGWGAAHSVIWNCDAAGGHVMVQQPPTAQNYAIGCFGKVDGNGPYPGGVGFIEGSNTAGLQPQSLYLAQLAERLGVAAPTFNPPAGTYTGAQSIAIATTTPGASIRYTTDGSTPTSTTGTAYTGAFTVSTDTTVKAIAFKSGATDSAVSTAVYVITAPQVAAPVFDPAGGTFTNAVSVTITSATPGASINYTLDGTTPSPTHGTAYTGPVQISVTAMLKAIAFKSGAADSTVTSATYAVNSSITLSFEAESIAYTASGATASVQSDTNSSGSKWVQLAGNSTGDFIEFTLPNVPAGKYQLKMMWKGNNNRGILSLKVDGAQLGSTLDQYSANQSYPTTTFGTVTFSTRANHTIRLTVTGKNSASSGEALSADKFLLISQ